MHRLVLLAGTVLLLGSCGGEEESKGGGSLVSPATCATYKTTAEIEEKIIMPKCGKKGGCHGDLFEPKFTMASQLRAVFLDKPGKLLCLKDKYINRTDPGKSFILAKIHATDSGATCPSGGAGGLRMPSAPDPPLPKNEVDCLTWWVYEAAAGR